MAIVVGVPSLGGTTDQSDDPYKIFGSRFETFQDGTVRTIAVALSGVPIGAVGRVAIFDDRTGGANNRLAQSDQQTLVSGPNSISMPDTPVWADDGQTHNGWYWLVFGMTGGSPIVSDLPPAGSQRNRYAGAYSGGDLPTDFGSHAGGVGYPGHCYAIQATDVANPTPGPVNVLVEVQGSGWTDPDFRPPGRTVMSGTQFSIMAKPHWWTRFVRWDVVQGPNAVGITTVNPLVVAPQQDTHLIAFFEPKDIARPQRWLGKLVSRWAWMRGAKKG